MIIAMWNTVLRNSVANIQQSLGLYFSVKDAPL